MRGSGIQHTSASPASSANTQDAGRLTMICDSTVLSRTEMVWLSTRDIRLRLPCCKLSPRYIGPFTVQGQINKVTYRLNLPSQYHISQSFHTSLLKPYSDPLFSSSPESRVDEVPPPPLDVTNEELVYWLQNILNSQRRGWPPRVSD